MNRQDPAHTYSCALHAYVGAPHPNSMRTFHGMSKRSKDKLLIECPDLKDHGARRIKVRPLHLEKGRPHHRGHLSQIRHSRACCFGPGPARRRCCVGPVERKRGGKPGTAKECGARLHLQVLKVISEVIQQPPSQMHRTLSPTKLAICKHAPLRCAPGQHVYYFRAYSMLIISLCSTGG